MGEQAQEGMGEGDKGQAKAKEGSTSKTADEIEEKKKGVCNGLVLFEGVRTLNVETH